MQTASAGLRRTSIVWAGLVMATLVSWGLGSGHGTGSRTVASVAILLIAFVKARFVIAYFMEIREAPIALRVLVEGWCVVVFAVVVVLYLAG